MRKEANGEWRMANGKRRRRLSPIRYSLFAAAAMAAASSAHAQDAAQCTTVAEAEQIATVFGGQSLVTLTPAQAAVARSMFSIATLESAPGDEVAISLHSDGTAYVYFLDRGHDQACSPIRLFKVDVAAVISAKGQ
jgi:phosphotransferase system HPr-like phosphotransfer protein